MNQPVSALRVVSVPAAHPYPQALLAGAGHALEVYADPDPDDPSRPAAGRWWPHRGLEPAWLAERPLDLLHVHFGFDHRTPRELQQLVDHLRGRGCPLVLTVHDLRSPHQVDPSVLDAQLDVLVPAADAVTTLTPWAAEQVSTRWGVEAAVHRHPPVVPADHSEGVRRHRVAAEAPVVSVACKSLRPNCDPARLLGPLLETTRRHGARLRVLVHGDVVHHHEVGPRRDLVSALDRAGAGGAEVVVHEPMSDQDLWAEVAGHDVAVLPYRFGTHSGWLEMCHDLGTAVAAPSFGAYASQGADGVYVADEDEVDESSLSACVGALVERARTGALAGDDASEQRRRARDAAQQNLRLYRAVAGRSSGTAAAS